MARAWSVVLPHSSSMNDHTSAANISFSCFSNSIPPILQLCIPMHGQGKSTATTVHVALYLVLALWIIKKRREIEVRENLREQNVCNLLLYMSSRQAVAFPLNALSPQTDVTLFLIDLRQYVHVHCTSTSSSKRCDNYPRHVILQPMEINLSQV